MRLIDRLRRRATSDETNAAERSFEAALYGGHENLDVVGESHYQDNLWRIAGGRSSHRVDVPVGVVLIPEANNPHDANAISVWINGLQVGHLPRDLAAAYRPGLVALQNRERKPIALNARVIGGGMRQDGIGLLGVFVDHDPTDFGIAHHGIWDGAIYEGESASIRAGRLSWLTTLPNDPAAALDALRGHLAAIQDALDRHFLFLELEKHLYRARTLAPSMLEEFDAVCHAHDQEMDEIRRTLQAEFEGIPRLATYHQMAIRQAKAHNWERARWWATRGLALYGSDAVSADWVADLEKRLAACESKLTGAAAIPAADKESTDRRARQALVDSGLGDPHM